MTAVLTVYRQRLTGRTVEEFCEDTAKEIRLLPLIFRTKSKRRQLQLQPSATASGGRYYQANVIQGISVELTPARTIHDASGTRRQAHHRGQRPSFLVATSPLTLPRPLLPQPFLLPPSSFPLLPLYSP